MSVKRIAVPLLLGIVLTAVAIALRGKGRLPDRPEDAVKAFFTAAQEGDAAAYQALLCGTLKKSFDETQSQLGAAAYRESLRNSVVGLKGFAVSRTEETSEDRAVLDVELIFADRSERQRFIAVRQPRGWSIESIDRAAVEKNVKSYGAPVYDLTPSADSNPEPPSTDSPQPDGL